MPEIPKSRTRGQLYLERLLNELGLKTDLEHQIGKYFVDVWVEELKTAFEFDGPGHGLLKKHDEVRDEWFKSQGIRTIRVSYKGLNKEYLLERILE